MGLKVGLESERNVTRRSRGFLSAGATFGLRVVLRRPGGNAGRARSFECDMKMYGCGGEDVWSENEKEEKLEMIRRRRTKKFSAPTNQTLAQSQIRILQTSTGIAL